MGEGEVARMSSKKASWLKHLDFMMGDVFWLLMSYGVACLVKYRNFSFVKDVHHQRMVVAIIAACLLTSFAFESYQGIIRRGLYKEFRAVITHVSLVAAEILLYLFLVNRLDDFSRSIYGMTVIFGLISIYLSRIGWKRVIKKRLATNPYRERLLVITKQEFAEEFISELLAKKYTSYKLDGCVIYDKEMEDGEIQGAPIVCKMSELANYVKLQVIDEVLIRPDKINEKMRKTIQEIVNMGIVVHIELTKIFGELPDMRANRFDEYKVITISIHRARIRQLFAKRVMDIAGGIVGLIITGIVFVIVAPAIKKQSPGPIFFSQERVGKNGRKFKLYKFRSMYKDAEGQKQELMKENKMQGHMFKVDNDPRVTPIGATIRKYSLDELPQFWNVLKGEMSLVGSRPPTVDEFEKYDKRHRIRLSIKPGMTGMWQVSGRSDIVDFEEVVRLDEEYIRNWYLGLDLKIIFQTVLEIFGKNGSV